MTRLIAMAVAAVAGAAGLCRAEDARPVPALVMTRALPPVQSIARVPSTSGEFWQNDFLWRDFSPWSDRSGEVDEAGLRRVRTVKVSAGAAAAPTAKFRPWPVLGRPSWVWPPLLAQWGAMPGPAGVAWTWQAGWQSASAGSIRLASRFDEGSAASVAAIAPNPPWWLAGVWTVTAADAMPLWPRVRAPDLGIPVGSSRFADRSILEPPARYLRWSDRIETVLADDRDSVQEVTRRCQAVGVKPHFPGGMLYGCTHWAAGRCLITRIDDPGVARHELGHCNGWPSGHPR